MIKLEYKGLNTFKFHDELIKANIIPSDINYSIQSSSEQDKIWILFGNLKEEVQNLLDDDGNIIGETHTYKKCVSVSKTIIVQEPIVKEIVEEEIIIEDVEQSSDVDAINVENYIEADYQIELVEEDIEEVIEYKDVEKTITVDEWQDFDGAKMIADIQNIVDSHDPTPLPSPITTDEMIEMLILDNLNLQQKINEQDSAINTLILDSLGGI
jgi:hypothetical protein